PLVAFLLVVFAATNFAGENPAPASPIAIVMKVVKDVSFKKADGDWTTIKIGQALSTGDEIRTGAKSLALVKFTDNSILRVRENCSIKIYADKNEKVISKNTYIGKGGVNFEVAKQQQNEEFQFTTPTMVASIRGTKGFFQVGDNGTVLVLEEGAVDYKSLLGEQIKGNVRGGNSVVFTNDGQVTVSTISPQQQRQLEDSKKTNTKKIIIKTNQGDLIIEYLEE
ncbi:MAG: FecR family protein, partial [Ignavibacteria bacterium]|nr:FecR family protein [Ignavibacteria bacterium]